MPDLMKRILRSAVIVIVAGLPLGFMLGFLAQTIATVESGTPQDGNLLWSIPLSIVGGALVLTVIFELIAYGFRRLLARHREQREQMLRAIEERFATPNSPTSIPPSDPRADP